MVIKMGKKRISMKLVVAAITFFCGIMFIAGLLIPGDFVITIAPLIGSMYEVEFEQIRNAWLLIAGIMILGGLWYFYKRK